MKQDSGPGRRRNEGGKAVLDRHKAVANPEIVTAGSSHSNDIPGIQDLNFVTPKEHDTHLGCTAACKTSRFSVEDDAVTDNPGTEINSGPVSPLSGYLVAARGGDGLSRRVDRAGDDVAIAKYFSCNVVAALPANRGKHSRRTCTSQQSRPRAIILQPLGRSLSDATRIHRKREVTTARTIAARASFRRATPAAADRVQSPLEAGRFPRIARGRHRQGDRCRSVLVRPFCFSRLCRDVLGRPNL